ncbi:MAG: hypothetical protein V4754_02865 [Pseudomonadota bacterium]
MSAKAGRAKRPAAAAVPSWLDELALVRHAGQVFLLTLVSTAVLVGASRWLLQGERDARAAALLQRGRALDTFAELRSEKRDIALFQTRYAALRARGWIGEEKRLDWIEAIRQIQAERKLLPITYDIEPQQAVKLDGQLATGEYQLYGSRMNMRMDLLHEMDLIHLLDDLKQRGLFAAQSCTIKRNAMVMDNGSTGPATRLLADCTLNWLTLGLPQAPVTPPTAAPALAATAGRP